VPCHQCPASSASPKETNYLLVTGPGTMFHDSTGPSFRDIQDGTSNTVLAVEIRGAGITWAEPEDLDINGFVAMFGPRGTRQHVPSHLMGLNALFADGSVKFLRYDMAPETARALATCAGGETVGGF
jgi:prepilin-type processing-associated H-X9-DG protein